MLANGCKRATRRAAFWELDECAMRLAATVCLAILQWGYVSTAMPGLGIPKWIAAVVLLIVGIALQLTYARLVNSHFDAVGMPEAVRLRLRDDRGVVPFWIATVGVVARSFMMAGTILPLLEAAGCYDSWYRSG